MSSWIKKRLRFFSIACGAGVFFACSVSTKKKAEVSEKIPENHVAPNVGWVSEPDANGFYLVMDKEGNSLVVRSFSYPTKVLREYRAISGSKPGDKKREGDHRTPEGIYFVENEIPKKQLQALHGAQAFALNYPNPIDRIRKQSGSGIWIHGVDNENRMKKRFDTRGCVALSNVDIVDLGLRLQSGFQRTPIVVVDQLSEQFPIGLLPPDSAMSKRIFDWAAAWSSRDVDAYLAFYSPDFRGRGMKFETWKAYKKNLANYYTKIEVQIKNLRVLRHGKYAVAVFEQIYRSDKHQALTDKRLYLVGEGENALILSEESLDRKQGPAGSFEI